jgi:hypothetical protein
MLGATRDRHERKQAQDKTWANVMETLERRIAAAFGVGDTPTAAELGRLIEEATAAAAAADEAAQEERKKGLDPTTVVDTQAASVAIMTAELTRDRLQAALPRLQHRLTKIEAQERYDRWLVYYEAVKAKRDAAAAELHVLYAPFVVKMMDLLLQIEQIDAEVRRLANAKPYDADAANGDGRNLRPVEAEARGVEGFRQDQASIMRDLKLPHWAVDAGFAWPPHRPMLLAQLSEHDYNRLQQQQERIRQQARATAEEAERRQVLTAPAGAS